MTIRRVKQRHHNGCAPAALAMISGFSYRKCLKAVLPKRKRGGHVGDVELENVLRALHKLKVPHRLSFDKNNLFIKNSIIIVNYNDQARHCVVWDVANKNLIDPIENTPYKEKNVNKSYCRRNFSIIIEILS